MGVFSKTAAAVLVISGLAVGSASAAASVNWTDWTAQPTSTHADGSITTGSGTVGVGYDGAISFTQLTPSTDYWYENPLYGASGYTQQGLAVNRPTGTDIIALNGGGQKTITFSQAVVNPYLAFTSWNGNHVTFGTSVFNIISQGCGYWGCGSFATFGGNTGFDGAGEVHGVLQFQGTFTSLNFTDTSEFWHGFTVGIGDIASPGIPEPATWAMLIMGFGGIGAVLRRRRRQTAFA